MKIVTNNITVPLQVNQKQARVPFANMKKKVMNKKITIQHPQQQRRNSQDKT